MSENLYIGVDLGTTKIKVGIFDTSGCQRSLVSHEFYFANHPLGYLEFDADAYIKIVFESIKKSLTSSTVDTSKIRGMSIASQAQTFVLVGSDDKPIRPAISWLDIRAKKEAIQISELSRKTLNCETDAMASAPKICWIVNNEYEIFKQAKYVLLLPDYLTYKLIGRRITDVRAAESTGLYDRTKSKWIESLLDFCSLKKEMMSEVSLPGEVAGKLRPTIAEKLGLPPETIVAVGAMDQLAGAVGTGNVELGSGSISLGTALAIIVSAKAGQKVKNTVFVRPHPVKELDALLMYVKTAGIVIRWFKENFADSLSYEDLFGRMANIPIGSEGLKCVPHFNGTTTSKFDPSAQGVFSGVSLKHSKYHFARSIVEGLCFMISENLRNIAQSVGEVKFMRAIGGGAKSDVWLQIIADSTGMQIDRPLIMEACCFGAAQFAMVADGVFKDIVEVSTTLYKNEHSFFPDYNAKKCYDELFSEYRNFYRCLGLY